MGQKYGFLSLLKNFGISFSCIYSTMKVDIICYIPSQIPYLGKIWFLIYKP